LKLVNLFNNDTSFIKNLYWNLEIWCNFILHLISCRIGFIMTFIAKQNKPMVFHTFKLFWEMCFIGRWYNLWSFNKSKIYIVFLIVLFWTAYDTLIFLYSCHILFLWIVDFSCFFVCFITWWLEIKSYYHWFLLNKHSFIIL
jgi:hypothetical protein